MRPWSRRSVSSERPSNKTSTVCPTIDRSFAVEIECPRAVLVGVEKHADVIELNVVDERKHFVEVVFGFAGETHNEGCAQPGAGHHSAYGIDLLLEHVSIAAAPHAIENRPASMLVRNVEVLAQAVLFGNQPHKVVGDHIRIAIKETNPLHALDPYQFT